MARRKKRRRGEESIAGYFKKVFAERPDWLDVKSNADILARYRTDHGLPADAVLDKGVTNGLSNTKSVLRNTGRKKKKAKSVATGVATAPTSSLERLEEMIDDCLTTARAEDREGLSEVILALRRARNALVWKLGV